MTKTNIVEHISFSSLKDWKTCPYYFKLTRIDKVGERVKNIFTEFGSAMHETLEMALTDKIGTSNEELVEDFTNRYGNYVKNIPDSLYPTDKDIATFLEQGKKIIVEALPAVREYFGDFEVVSVEEDLMENIESYKEAPFKFKGYIDLVIKTSDGKYHIIDWKTTSWGWDSRKKSDPMVTYQLTFYKNYFAKKHNIDPDNIETYFCLMKRTAKSDPVEVYRVTSGLRKTGNALKMLEHCVYNVHHQRFIKNRLSCSRCEFNKTEHCP